MSSNTQAMSLNFGTVLIWQNLNIVLTHKSGRSIRDRCGISHVQISEILALSTFGRCFNHAPRNDVSTPRRLRWSRTVENFLRVCAAFAAENGRIAICGDRAKFCWRAADLSSTSTRTRTPPTVTKIWQRHRGPKKVLLARR